MRTLVCWLWIPLAAFAQSGADVRPRTLGAVFDADAQAVRPMLGAPGAAVLGEPYAAGAGLERAAVSSRHGYVLGVREGRLSASSLASGRTLAAFDFAADLLALSPQETAAAAYSAAEGTVAIVVGLPAAPRLARTFAVAGAAPLSALGVSDDGALVLTASADGAVLAHREDGSRQMAAVGRVAAIRLADGAALLADEERETVWRLALDDSPPSVAARLPGPVLDAAPAPGGRGVIALVRDSRAVYLADASGAVSALECDCTPERLAPLPGRARFLLTGPALGAVWVFDAGGLEPNLFFVPSADGRKE